MRISDWSSDVCSSDLLVLLGQRKVQVEPRFGVAAGRGQQSPQGFDVVRGSRLAAQLRQRQVCFPLRRIEPQALAVFALGAVEVAGESQQRGEVEARSEEHTSELQSLMRISYAVFCLKKKTKNTTRQTCP